MNLVGRFYWYWDPVLCHQKSREVVQDECAAHFSGLIPHAEFVDGEGAGHMVADDSNGTFAAKILDLPGNA
jgi:hypothetical protein